MKLLYIVPKIKNAGGVARVLSLKANYFLENFGYEIHFLSQNEAEINSFYSFNEKTIFHNMNLNGNAFNFFNAFRKSVKQKVKEINPDVILIADNGLKAFIYPFIVSRKIPIIFECHSSKFIQEEAQNQKNLLKLKYWFKNFGAGKFTKMVVLSNESLKEWDVENAVVIPNPSWVETELTASLQSKRAMAVARNSYEKGLDRLLFVWKEITQKYPDWTLDIYTDDVASLEKEARKLGIKSRINYLSFVSNIEDKYIYFSIFLMTSRSEGFPMVLLEAMSFGLPCIAYDCPIGPRSIIEKGKSGILIPDGDVEEFVEKISFLIENDLERLTLGKNAKEAMKNFSLDKIMTQWKLLLESL